MDHRPSKDYFRASMSSKEDGLFKNVCHYSQFCLPVTLSESGFKPFVISFLICYIVQVLTIFFFTEVLQKAYCKNVEILETSDKDNVPIHTEKNETVSYGSDYDLASKADTGLPCFRGHTLEQLNARFKPDASEADAGRYMPDVINRCARSLRTRLYDIVQWYQNKIPY
ncbi:unnamed protein product [Didymodactylos carnosus]|uniref:Uncharacterized protein n=1 Tax=Didymodactylos carnosus TaxID=1234261 RepID=A0A814XIJ1_9BILA|nr:unnamed protein product [Didymodactylos carnosus]CAF3980693.1 unnamed protein product [Didymodactylos carnosus]